MMKKEEILEKVLDILAEKSSVEKEDIKEDSLLIDDLEFDSLELVDLTMDIETEIGVSIEDTELEKIKTVKDVVDIIISKQ
ncbi:MAG: acyl carrier protein [Thermotogae bacterium]|nr:acyl carrier protein [Thermotogota bacterium]